MLPTAPAPLMRPAPRRASIIVPIAFLKSSFNRWRKGRLLRIARKPGWLVLSDAPFRSPCDKTRPRCTMLVQ
jgi:hypothetical protein